MKEIKLQQEQLKNLEHFIACHLWHIHQLKKFQILSSGPKLFQLYIHRDKSFTDDLIERSKRSGFDGMCLTVDTICSWKQRERS